ncbi:hypothetical protein [Paucidesulfovibrio longus]|uniref:hypothetical protein n=1 Tax=Paucidesulfovibrio longus TaxID=889 RepID=UPI0003B684DC|nr:hypothetical protein [Paucidesulfovibrio longus]
MLRSYRPFLGAIALFLATFAGSCDHTVLRGEIVPAHGPFLAAGQTVRLSLKVPEELDGIHDEYWLVTPRDAGRFEPEDARGRTAVFRALRPGPCTVEVWGFYRQTNPQPITTIKLNIHP